MNEKPSNLRPPLGAGILTVLMVLVVLLLCSFAVMSLLSANADAHLTDKALSAITAYYDADAQAERTACDIAAIMKSNGDWRQELPKLGVSVLANNNKAQLSFFIPFGDGSKLWVQFDQPLKGGKPSGPFVRTRWQTIVQGAAD